jgi:ferric-dicitrate binding protein FerR (iron transport regulator)
MTKTPWTKNALFAAWALLLCIGTAHPQNDAGADWRYTVRPKDTVSELTRSYLKSHIRWTALAEYNRLPDANRIQAGTQLRMPLHWLSLQQTNAQLTAIAGDVQTRLLDGTWRAARTGEPIQTGQHVQVGRNSSARLQFADQSTLVIQPDSTVVMDSLSLYAGGLMVDTRLRLQTGRVEVLANPQGRRGQQFEVITPAAVASVRGTQFVVEATQTRTVQQTNQGQVVLQTNQGKVTVQEGYSSVAQVGEKPMPPQVTRPAPELENPVSRFVDFPITFAWAEQIGASAWVMQIGLDPQMSQLTFNLQSPKPKLNPGALPDGRYHLRAWYVDSKDVPSQAALHSFEVAIPRYQQGPAVKLPPHYFAAGPVSLQLAPLPDGRRYLLQVTSDAEGRQPVWHQTQAKDSVVLPVPPESDRTHHLWIWLY